MIATVQRNEKRPEKLTKISSVVSRFLVKIWLPTRANLLYRNAKSRASRSSPAFVFKLSKRAYLVTVYFACGVITFCETRSVIFAVTVYSPASASLS